MHIPTIAEASALIAARKLSPVELVSDCLERIDSIDASLHSFITVTAERDREAAKAAEGRMMRGELKGKLDGIPIGHKDIYFTRGVLTTAHSRHLEQWVLSCLDRIIITGTLPGACYAGGMTSFLYAHGIRIFDYPRFAEPLRNRIRERAQEVCAAAGVQIEYVNQRHLVEQK
ncbi:amidase family protein [Paraburkholderia sp. BL10I2N1]|uniref:amidase family protein n=1 Tax=Paraburkholderia sp. BL10I2N1 TaxID=1938796 RepID=UPI00105FB1A8|nr:amidase family protein [Paraburkholderia sp. BL10I2N1]